MHKGAKESQSDQCAFQFVTPRFIPDMRAAGDTAPAPKSKLAGRASCDSAENDWKADELTNVVRAVTRRADIYVMSRYLLLTKRYVEAVHLRPFNNLSSAGIVMRWSYATSAVE